MIARTSRIDMRNRLKTLAALALFAAGISGCGGSSHSSFPSAPTAATANTVKTQAVFRIDIPRTGAAANKRSAQYVSPATTQMQIDIQQNSSNLPGYPITVGLTPTSGGCSSTLANTYCQLTVSLAPGSYTAYLSTEDSSNNQLSAAQGLPFTIVAGANNLIPVTLSGIPHTLQVSSAARAVHGNGASGLTLYGSASQTIAVSSLDADGNIIVGPGAPTYSASVVYGSGWSIAAPSSAAPNTMVVTPPGTNAAGATFSLSVTLADGACDINGAICSTTFTMKNDIQTLFANDSSDAEVYVLAPPYTGSPTIITCGTGNTSAIALDPAGDVFVSSQGSAVAEYSYPFSSTAAATISNGILYPLALAFDHAGHLFVANYAIQTITVYAPPYTGAPTATMATSAEVGGGPSFMALDAAGDLAVTNQGSSPTVEVYAPPYTGSPTILPSTVINPRPNALTFDAAGQLFVTDVAHSVVQVFAPPFTSASETVAAGISSPVSLLIDSSGNLFVGNANGGVTEYAPPYSGVPVATIATGINVPISLVEDGAGNLFVSNAAGNNVTEYAPPYTGAPIATISVPNASNLALTP